MPRFHVNHELVHTPCGLCGFCRKLRGMAAPQHDDGSDGWVAEDTWGARLALVRQRMGWNYEQAGHACEIEPETWRQWEKVGRSPRKIHEVARRISDQSGANYVWLMAGGPLRSRCFSLALVPPLDGQQGQLDLGLPPLGRADLQVVVP